MNCFNLLLRLNIFSTSCEDPTVLASEVVRMAALLLAWFAGSKVRVQSVAAWWWYRLCNHTVLVDGVVMIKVGGDGISICGVGIKRQNDLAGTQDQTDVLGHGSTGCPVWLWGPGSWQGINFLACTLKQTQARVCGANCKRLQFLPAVIDFFSNTALFPGIESLAGLLSSLHFCPELGCDLQQVR